MPRISAGSEPGKGLENERHSLRERLYCRFSPVPGSAVPFGDLRGTRTQTLRRAGLLQRGRLDACFPQSGSADVTTRTSC
jgi:hypothetical protein